MSQIKSSRSKVKKMLALQNLNILLNNSCQMGIFPKNGIFQYSSFNYVKKISQIDAVCSELLQTLQLVKDLKCENIFDCLPSVKSGISHKSSEWFSFEGVANKLSKGKQNLDSSHDDKTTPKKHKEPNSVGKLLCDLNNINKAINNDIVGSFDFISSNSCESELNHSQCNLGNNRKSIISQILSFKNISKQSILKNGSLYNTSRLQLHRNEYRDLEVLGQRRGFRSHRSVTVATETSYPHQYESEFEEKKNKSGRTESMGKAFRNEGGTEKSGGRKAEQGIPEMNTFLNGLYKALKNLLFFIWCAAGLLFMIEISSLAFMYFSNSSVRVAEKVNVTFEDAKGMDEAKAELKCIVQFLKDPSQFMYLGGKLPKGVLLQGPPGTGKTLLARAVAGEANVNFFHACGSEFDEILVGEGARRIRNLFNTARKNAPAVIFIDEIDAVGGKRVSSPFHPNANQTIIQLLSEMDGFLKNDEIIVIGATNRETALDEALLRPGRFDLKIELQKPDIKGRTDILKLYLNKIVHKDIDVDYFAKRTVGFSGAELMNLVNQAVLIAATEGGDYVTTYHMDQALEKIALGPARKSMVRTEKMNRITAYHESGHATVSFFTPSCRQPIKATIIPRGKVLGHVSFLDDETGMLSKAELLARIDAAMGGRAAEELVFGPDKVTTGCETDLEFATKIARGMVRHWGMSEKIGLRVHETTNDRFWSTNDFGQAAGDDIDSEIKRIIQESYERAKKILKEHAKEHKLLAEALLAKETLEEHEIIEILSQGKKDDSSVNNS